MKLLTYQPSEINSGKTYKFLTKESDHKYQHNYVYLIQNKDTLMMYPGVRSCDIEPLNDIGHKYFTSSKYTHFKDDPENWNVWIIQDFDKRSDATCLETALHKQHGVSNNNLFYNRCNASISGFDTTGNIEISNKISKSNKGRKFTKEHKNNISKYHYNSAGKNNGMYNKTHSEKTRILMSNRKNEIQENGKTISENAAILTTKTKNEIQENGKTISENASIIAVQTMSIVQDDGETIREKATKKMKITKNTPDEFGFTNAQKSSMKAGKTAKENKSHAGGRNGRSKKYVFIDENDIEQFCSFGNLKLVCNEHNITMGMVFKSIKENKPFYFDFDNFAQRMKSRIINNGKIKWLGWKINEIV